MKLIKPDASRVVIQIQEPRTMGKQKGRKSKCISLYETTVDEVFDLILKMLEKEGVGG